MSTFKKSSLRLYYTSSASKWELLPHKLFIVDNIENYLATKTYLSINSFQYQRPQLELSIVVDLSQTYAEPLNQSFKYVRIENSDQENKYYYYFVKNTIWRSKSAVRFELVMDVLNTFQEGRDYEFKDNTKITREHKDRFRIEKPRISLVFSGSLSSGTTLLVGDNVNVYLPNGTSFVGMIAYYDENVEVEINVTSDIDINDIVEGLDYMISSGDSGDFSNVLDPTSYVQFDLSSYQIKNPVFRNIDYIPENINPQLQCGTAEGNLIENNKTLLQGEWYLLYRNQNDPSESQQHSLVNPVDCYLIPSESKAVSTGVITSGQIDGGTLELGKMYFIPLHVVGATTQYLIAEAYNQTIILSNGVSLGGTADVNDFTFVTIKKTSDGKIEAQYNNVQYNAGNDLFVVSSQAIYSGLDYITISQSPTYYAESTEADVDLHDLFAVGLNTTYRKTFTYTATGQQINPITVLDRTDSKNIKLIKVPYCPYNFDIVSSKIDIANSDWNFVDLTQADNTHIKILKLNDLNIKLTANITPAYQPLTNLYIGTINAINPLKTDLRKGASYESKLFNSEFYKPTYVYDSFAYSVDLEKCDPTYYTTIVRTQTFNIVFDMTRTINSKFMFTYDSLHLRNAVDNYAKCMPIARNNEEVLYNVPYINYIRSGYNYDIKAKNLATTSSWIGAGLSLAGAGLSLLAPSVPLKVMGVVSSLISMAMTTKNAITSTIQNEQSIQRKLHEAKLQTASVSGSDDVDLMSVYAENRLKYLIYEPSEIMKNMLYNLFFYAGYSSNRLGLPNHNTRLNFDYLECDAVINEVGNIPDDCINELINCFKNGVTYIHETERVSDKYDFDQVYENWEKSLGVN